MKQKDPGLDDYFPTLIEGGKFDGKFMAIPVEINTGNTNIILYNKNKDRLDEQGSVRREGDQGAHGRLDV